MTKKKQPVSEDNVSLIVDGEDFSKQEYRTSKAFKNFFDVVESFIYAIIAVALNLTVGILGELSLGHAGFMCVGAFSSAFFSLCFKRLRDCYFLLHQNLLFLALWVLQCLQLNSQKVRKKQL